MRKNSIKNTRINEEVLRRLSEIIRGSIKDPRIHPMTSVVSVEVAPDLKTCKAYVSVLGDERSRKDTLAGLKSAEGYIRHSLAQSANLRYTPQITFIMDQSIAYGVHMSHYIDEINKTSGNGQPAGEADGQTSGNGQFAGGEIHDGKPGDEEPSGEDITDKESAQGQLTGEKTHE